MSDDIVNSYLVGKDGVQFDPSEPLLDAREEATAQALAAGMSQTKIAKQQGVTPAAISLYIKAHPAVEARVRYLREISAAQMGEHGSANRLVRLSKYQDILDKLEAITNERAEAAMNDKDAQFVPGAKTGMLVRQIKSIRTDNGYERVEEWAFDKSVYNAAMEVTERIARETGQWTEKKDVQQETVVRVFHTEGDIQF